LDCRHFNSIPGDIGEAHSAGGDDDWQAYLPHLDKINGLHMSLNLEAVK
jgi:hypothetical protein